ncbi:MAG TPA: class I SAM-dependent methyltransferase [Bryobacteraceae bacterium]|nr:class I SAM-dependent methyltransferase [Bryobacteraceae bacterium]
MLNLIEQFGDIDIYLFDQLLRGRITSGMRIFDAGCGAGRNLVYFLRNGYEVFGVDTDENAVRRMQALAATLTPGLPAQEHFRNEPIELTTFPNQFAHVVICSAVLHFARDHAHFDAMLAGAWRLLKPGGLFFCRLASLIGMDEGRFRPLGQGRFLLPDGSERYLVDEARLTRANTELTGQALDPLKTTVVQNERCMTTWVVRKR